ncbi:MAG TPA: Dabb family protein [Ktedonobacteraceae bacterium]|nr:Dabb family protein [Ktedonobacteraceae bacterium]
MNVIHILLLKPQSDVSPEQFQEAITALLALRQKIAGIVDVQAYPSMKLNDPKDYTHIVTFTFESEQHFEAYLPHPEHLVFIRAFAHRFDNLIAFDYLQNQNQ